MSGGGGFALEAGRFLAWGSILLGLFVVVVMLGGYSARRDKW